MIPAATVLVEQQDGLATWTHARAQARGLDLHQRDETMHLGHVLRELGQNAPKTQRILAQRWPHPVLSRRCRVAFVEDEIDDLEHRLEPGRQLRAAWHFNEGYSATAGEDWVRPAL